MNEFYEEWFFETHFFICKAIGETERKLTSREQKVRMLPKWVDIQDAIDIFLSIKSMLKRMRKKEVYI